MRDATFIQCRTCDQTAITTPPKRGPLRVDCDRCVAENTAHGRATECEVCNRSIHSHEGRGRPAKTCSPACRARYRAVRENRPDRVVQRHGYLVYKARREAEQPEVVDCAMCGQPVDAAVPGPHGDLETGFSVHEARGSDASEEFFSCADRYAAMRRSQRLQDVRRKG